MPKPKPAITVHGSKELARDLKKAGDQVLLDELKAAHKAAAESVKDAVQVPTVSGRLASSLRASASARSGRVAIGKKAVPYAAPIHWGWPARNIAPNPFLITALEREKEVIVGDYEKAVEKVADSVKGKRGLL